MPRRAKNPTVDSRKQSLLLPDEMIEELQREARRLDVPMSRLVRRAWKIAKEQITSMPAPPSAPPPHRATEH